MKDGCFLITKPTQGGGNVISSPRIIVRRTAAIGDAIAASIVADKLAEKGYECEFQTHVNIHCVLRYQQNISLLRESNGYAHVDLDRSYETNPARRNLHFSEMFLAKANETLMPYGISLGPALNCRPVLRLPNHIVEAARVKFSDYPRPWVFMVPRSNTYNVRQVPDNIWQSAARNIKGTSFWLGTTCAPQGIVDLQARHLDNIVSWLSVADVVVSVDTGPLHIAAALGRQIVALGQSSSPELHLSDQVDYETIWPLGSLPCLNCQQNICQKDYYMPPCQLFSPEIIADKVNRKIVGLANADISAVVSIFRPDVGVLNRCLEQVIPQVREVVVCADQAGIIPDNALRHGKVRYIRHRLFDIGYGRKQNACARHTHGKYLLLLNDDVFLDPEAVARMREVFERDPKVGMVSNLLRYADGTIYHAGKVRAPGVRGWGHINHRQHLPDLKDVTELENCCGACVMISRECFYGIGGFDEEFYLYAEDDDMALRVRKAGYKIMFTPHSSGTHLEHQSTSKTGPIVDRLNKSNAVFGRKWGAYFDHNLQRVPGNFDYLKP